MIDDPAVEDWHVLILDPSRLERDCALAELASASGMRAEAYESVHLVPAGERPDALLVRLARQPAGGGEAANPIGEVIRRWPDATTIVIAEDREVMLDSLLCGARAVVTGTSSLTTILDVIRLARQDLYVIPRMLVDGLRDLGRGEVAVPPERFDVIEGFAVTGELPRIEGITERQRKVLEFLSVGMPNKQIARELSLSESTVKAHVRAIMDRLGVANRTQIVSRLLGGRADADDAPPPGRSP